MKIEIIPTSGSEGSRVNMLATVCADSTKRKTPEARISEVSLELSVSQPRKVTLAHVADFTSPADRLQIAVSNPRRGLSFNLLVRVALQLRPHSTRQQVPIHGAAWNKTDTKHRQQWLTGANPHVTLGAGFELGRGGDWEGGTLTYSV